MLVRHLRSALPKTVVSSATEVFFRFEQLFRSLNIQHLRRRRYQLVTGCTWCWSFRVSSSAEVFAKMVSSGTLGKLEKSPV